MAGVTLNLEIQNGATFILDAAFVASVVAFLLLHLADFVVGVREAAEFLLLRSFGGGMLNGLYVESGDQVGVLVGQVARLPRCQSFLEMGELFTSCGGYNGMTMVLHHLC